MGRKKWGQNEYSCLIMSLDPDKQGWDGAKMVVMGTNRKKKIPERKILFILSSFFSSVYFFTLN